jgi:hypothetical protein
MNTSDQNTARIALVLSLACLIGAVAIQHHPTAPSADSDPESFAGDWPGEGSTPGPLVADKPEAEAKWISLFDGESLGGWKKTEFGGEGDVEVVEGHILLNMGYMTGVTSTREDLPRSGYEVELKAARLDGNDFFCGLTFPVNDSHCSLILGGWGGSVIGLSSIDGMDASENETTDYRLFKSGEWYRVRVRVRDDRIQAWLDDEPIIDQDIQGREVGIRAEMELSCPLGVATYSTTGGLKDIRLRLLPPSELVTD